ncbi:MAG: galactokinase [Sphaerochaeta sp.]|jgi:galactokinase|uniref:galactokinase n=1 Tax=Sphaerochaeta sp. TaxID=1972642 RepID=UPI002FC694CA
MDNVIKQHIKEYGEAPLVIAQVPGTCTLLGSYADACKGWSLVGTDSSSLFVAVSYRDDQLVRLTNATLNDRKRFSLTNIKYRKEDRWGNYLKAVIAILANEGVSFSGLNITVEGNLLYGDNQMVSTASALGTCLALNSLLDLKLSFTSLIRISYQANTSFNNEQCRISDLLTMLNGKPGKILFFDLQHVTYQELDFPFTEENEEYLAVIIDSKISPNAMREEINSKRKAIERAFLKLKELKSGGFLRDFPENELSARVVPLDEEARHNAEYVLMESHLANDAASLLNAKDAPLYGKLMNRVQAGLRDLLEVTCPEVDWLTKRATELSGCLGSVQIANGFSGNIMVLLSKQALPSYISRLEDYEHIFGFHPRWYPYAGHEAAKVVFPEHR